MGQIVGDLLNVGGSSQTSTQTDNTLTPDITNPPISSSVAITWEGDGGNENTRPSSLSVTLYKMISSGEEEVQTVQLTSANNWQYEVENLPTYEVRGDGRKIRISYYWRIDEVPEEYSVSYTDGSNETGINLCISTIVIDDLDD